jgi:hypothetical protein
MPNFDGKGPLKRGRVIGRSRGVCSKSDRECKDTSRDDEPETNDNRKAA